MCMAIYMTKRTFITYCYVNTSLPIYFSSLLFPLHLIYSCALSRFSGLATDCPALSHPAPPVLSVTYGFPARGDNAHLFALFKVSTMRRHFAVRCGLFPLAGGICDYFWVPMASMAHAREPRVCAMTSCGLGESNRTGRGYSSQTQS